MRKELRKVLEDEARKVVQKSTILSLFLLVLSVSLPDAKQMPPGLHLRIRVEDLTIFKLFEEEEEKSKGLLRGLHRIDDSSLNTFEFKKIYPIR
jgi:hypothetical protein